MKTVAEDCQALNCLLGSKDEQILKLQEELASIKPSTSSQATQYVDPSWDNEDDEADDSFITIDEYIASVNASPIPQACMGATPKPTSIHHLDRYEAELHLLNQLSVQHPSQLDYLNVVQKALASAQPSSNQSSSLASLPSPVVPMPTGASGCPTTNSSQGPLIIPLDDVILPFNF